MGSKRVYTAHAVGAKKNWTDREWQIYGDLPWIMQKFVDILIRVPRFVKPAGPRGVRVDRRSKFIERKLVEARRQASGKG